MPIYRKGDDQFELRHRALLEPQGFKHPETTRSLLDNPEAFISYQPHEKRFVVHEKDDSTESRYTDPETGEDVHEHSGPSYYPHKEYPVSGSDIAKLKRGR